MKALDDNKHGAAKKIGRFVFDEFEVDPLDRTCLRSGSLVPLTGKVFDLLVVFVENSNRLLGKDELIDRLWPDEFVEEGNLARNVSSLRKALGDTQKEHRYILTVQGRGYRFVAPVERPLSPATGIQENGEIHKPVNAPRRWFLWIGTAALAVFIALGFALSKFGSGHGNGFLSGPLSFRRLTTSGHVKKLAVSLDGHLIAFTSQETSGEGLYVRQTDVSNEINLAFVKGQIWSISFSPDNRLIYYSVFRGDASEGELFSVPVLGGVSRSYPGLSVMDFSLAPDGHHFAGVNTSRDRGEAVLVVDDLEGESERELTRRTFPSDFDAGDKKVSWSPNGRSIAVVLNERTGESPFTTLLLVDPITGMEDPITPFRWAQINSVQWVSDSSGLVVAGTVGQGESDQLFMVSLDGTVRQMTNDPITYSVVSANAGKRSIAAIETIRTSSIWRGSPDKFSEPKEIVSGSGALSPFSFSGDKIIFRATGIGGSDLWSVPIDGGEKFPLTQEAHVDSRGICSTPNGTTVFSSRRSGRNNLWRLNNTSGSLQQITFGENEIFPSCTPDGNWVVFQRMASANQRTSLWKVSIDGGEPQQLTDFLAVRPAVSPDGQWVSVFYMEDPKWKIGLVSIGGGRIEKSFDLPEGMGDRIARWSSDGRSILLVGNYGDVGNLWRVPIDGSPAEWITDLNQQNIEDFAVSTVSGDLFLDRSTTISDVFISDEDQR
ncbi:MAG: winged helix-turn-helix domain-containing protein [Acidobacteria bacterium]|nr:winged helix-turn-helix domain-containing protein [Acidobacteriota bacterium]